jgi:hypothetical protein
MNPIPSKQATTAKKVRRHVMCQEYGACLNMAIMLAWPGFSCNKCTDYRLEEQGDPAYFEVQNGRAADILCKVLARKPSHKGRRLSFSK